MKILITGALGYVGNEVLNRLTKKNFEIVANDNSKAAAERLCPIWRDKIEYIHCDVCELQCPADVDLVIHLAAEVGYVACDKNSEIAKRTNIEGTKRVASFGKPVLFFSTGSVYGAALKKTFTESSPCNPQTLYSKTKLEGEAIIKKVPSCIVRPATVYGMSYKTRHDLLVHTLVRSAVQEKKIRLFQPNAIRNIYNIKKIAEFVEYCIQNWHSCEGNIFNLGTESEILTKKEIVNKIAEHCDFNLELIKKSDPDCRDYNVSYRKLYDFWGNNEDKLDNNIEDIISYYKNSFFSDYLDKATNSSYL